MHRSGKLLLNDQKLKGKNSFQAMNVCEQSVNMVQISSKECRSLVCVCSTCLLCAVVGD